MSKSIQEETFSLQNKTILITGAGSGLGKHMALTLAKAGAFIILCGRNQESLLQCSQEIEALGGQCGRACLDVTEFDKIEQNVATIFERFVKVDVLINNAGKTSQTKMEPFNYPISEWDDIMNTNVKGMWVLSNAIAKKMIQFQIQGSIVNISSTNALRPRPTNSIYCISKSSVNSLTENLAIEYAKYGIRVNAIAPGILGVGMSQNVLNSQAGQELVEKRFPIGKIGELKDLDGPLFLLCSDASKYMTGDCLYIDGGLCTKSIM